MTAVPFRARVALTGTAGRRDLASVALYTHVRAGPVLTALDDQNPDSVVFQARFDPATPIADLVVDLQQTGFDLTPCDEHERKRGSPSCRV
ncbi:MAG: hypothetical protein IPK63_22065 [Candidatus Competibacteraceae bacterium]|nr:hypothetical protein [Candidatus Competibacteraceae bacterium]